MGNVKSIHTGEDVPTGPNEHLVKLFEDMLEMAKNGEVQAFIGTGFTVQGQRVSMWGDFHEDKYQMLGALSWLEHEYIYRTTAVDDDEMEEI